MLIQCNGYYPSLEDLSKVGFPWLSRIIPFVDSDDDGVADTEGVATDALTVNTDGVLMLFNGTEWVTAPNYLCDCPDDGDDDDAEDPDPEPSSVLPDPVHPLAVGESYKFTDASIAGKTTTGGFAPYGLVGNAKALAANFGEGVFTLDGGANMQGGYGLTSSGVFNKDWDATGVNYGRPFVWTDDAWFSLDGDLVMVPTDLTITITRIA